MTAPMTFGQRLRKLRRRAGLTHDSLAERAGLTIKTVSNLERGVHLPRRSTLDRLRQVLGPELGQPGPVAGRCPHCHRPL